MDEPNCESYPNLIGNFEFEPNFIISELELKHK